MKRLPIGVFDSGVGGLAVLRPDALSDLQPVPIILAPKGKTVSLTTILSEMPESVVRVFVCDVYIESIETESPIPGVSAGFQKMVSIEGRNIKIINIDHHAPDPRASRKVSSGNLAAEWVRIHGIPDWADSQIVVNHTDCDSVISAAIVAGRVDLEQHGAELEAAVIAADHSGEALPLAEMLQALDHERNIELSLSCLECHLAGEPPVERLRAFVEKRQADRQEFARLVNTSMRWDDDIAILALDQSAPSLMQPFSHNWCRMRPFASWLFQLVPSQEAA